MDMKKNKDAYTYLKDAFVSTMLDELMPGIFHNFANPLNGIMGRSKLMRRRLVNFVEKLKARYPEMGAETEDNCKKLLSDINMISQESERFYDQFCFATGKFYSISVNNSDSLNLSSLVEAEIGFVDFYLDFKHNVKKDVRIDRDMPDIYGITAFYSMSIWALIRASMKTIASSRDERFTISTDHDEKFASFSINPVPLDSVPAEIEELEHAIRTTKQDTSEPGAGHELLYALLLLKKAHEGIQIVGAGTKTLTIRIPF